MNYNDIKLIFSEKGCRLLDTNSEFNDKLEQTSLKKGQSSHHVKVTYTATCGHTNQVVVTNFKLRNTGILCKECSIKNSRNILNGRTNECAVIEATSFSYIESILSDSFHVRRTTEGCEADILIRPIESTTDLWLKIQLKSTKEKVYNMYSFSVLPHKYGNDVVYILTCEPDDTIWCVERCEIAHLKCKLNISNNSKYDKYECTHSSLIKKLEKIYDRYFLSSLLCTLEQGVKPKSIYQQREQKYIKLREISLPDWMFEYNDVEGLSYDFTVFGKRVQEKVCNAKKGTESYLVTLKRINGKNIETKRRIWVPYKQEDFDMLWVHIEYEAIFYVIPIKELADRELVITPTSKGRQNFVINIQSDVAWYSKYKFENNNLDINKLASLFV